MTDTQKKQKSYFNQSSVNRFVLDDGESFIEHKKLDEGLYQSYQDLTSRIKVDRESESTEVDMALGKQRHFLLTNLVTGWNLLDEDSKPIQFNSNRVLELPPDVISELIEDIYSKNKILGGKGDDAKEAGK